MGLDANRAANTTPQDAQRSIRRPPVTLRTRKFIRNQLLSRRQMVVYVTSIAAPGHYLVIGTNNELISL